jgi:hypothetical protein
MSRHITEPELAITERMIECRDMVASRNKRRYELSIDALICWRTEINGDWGFWSMPWYVGILKFCSCHDTLAHWNFSHAMIYRHTEILLLPWYAGILKSYSCHDIPAYWKLCSCQDILAHWHFAICHDMMAYWHLSHAMIYRHTETFLMPWYTGILKSYSCHDIPAYWNTCNSRYHLVTWYANKLIYLRPETWDMLARIQNITYAGILTFCSLPWYAGILKYLRLWDINWSSGGIIVISSL